MISLMQIIDKSGKCYPYGKILFTLNSGVKIYENTENNKELIVWLPEELRPAIFEWKNMCNEPFIDVDVRDKLFWPDKILIDKSSNEYCGYTTIRPVFDGEIVPLSRRIEKKRQFDAEEKKTNIIIGNNLARIYKVIKNSKQGYLLGVVSPDSFWIDESMNVYYMESFNCARNVPEVIRSCYVAPELLLHDSWKGKITAETDSFVYSLLLFQILTGRFPFNSRENINRTDVEYIWNLMCDGVSVFYDKLDEFSNEIVDELKKYSKEILDLFKRTFDYCGKSDYTKGRPKIEEWLEVLSEYIKNKCEQV